MLDILNAALDRLETSGFDPVIFILKSWSASRILESSKDFRRHDTEPGKPKALGLYRNKPAFSPHYRGSPIVVVADMKKLGTWLQYKPKQVFEEEQYISEEFSFSIKPFTRESALELIRKQPDIMKGKDGDIRQEEEVLIELQQRVHVRLVEQFEFEITDNKAGYKISMQR